MQQFCICFYYKERVTSLGQLNEQEIFSFAFFCNKQAKQRSEYELLIIWLSAERRQIYIKCILKANVTQMKSWAPSTPNT